VKIRVSVKTQCRLLPIERWKEGDCEADREDKKGNSVTVDARMRHL
jgi:hypothetical protein